MAHQALALDLKSNADPKTHFQHYVNQGLSLSHILTHACLYNNKDWAETALDAGVSPNGDEWGKVAHPFYITWMPLAMASKGRAYDCVRLLHDRGAFLDAVYGTKESAMRFAIHNADLKMVKLLLDLGADVRGDSENPWIDQAVDISCEMVELFLDYGGRPEDVHHTLGNNIPLNQMIHRRKACGKAAYALYKVLRKRYRIPAKGFPYGYKLPKELVEQMVRGVWDLRRKLEWVE